MTQIRSQKELQALYPQHFKVLQGYWLSGMTTKEQLNRIVAQLEKKKPQAENQPARPEPVQAAPPAGGEAPVEQAPPARKKPAISPQKKAFVLNLWEKRRLAGEGWQYYSQAMTKKTPIVFRGYGGQDLECIILKDGVTKFTVQAAMGLQVISKTDLQYACKKRSGEWVEKAVRIDEAVRAQGLQPVIPIEERYRIPDEDLSACKEAGRRLRLTMRGGEVLEGQVEWFGAYDIKLELETKKSVVVFRHAVYRHEEVQGESG